MSIIDDQFSYRNGEGRIELVCYDKNGYPRFKGHHPSRGNFTLKFSSAGIWLLNQNQTLPISEKVWRYNPIIPDNGLETKILPSVTRLVRSYNNSFSRRIVPATWKNVRLLDWGNRKKIKEIMTLLMIAGKRNHVNIPQEIVYYIFSYLNILLPLRIE